MPVHDVIADERGMAALKLGRDPSRTADFGKVIGRLGRDRKVVMPKVVGIPIAAPALWVLVKDYRNRRGVRRSDQRQGGCGN